MTGDSHRRRRAAVRDGTGQVHPRRARQGRASAATLGWFTRPSALRNRLSAGQMVGRAQADVVGTNARRHRSSIVMPNNGLVQRRAIPAREPHAYRRPARCSTSATGTGTARATSSPARRPATRLVLRTGPGQRAVRRRGHLMSDGWRPFVNLARGRATSPVTAARTSSAAPDGHEPMTIFPGNGATGFQAPVLAPARMRTFNQIGAGSWNPRRDARLELHSPGGAFVPFVGHRRVTWPATTGWSGPGDVDGDERGRPGRPGRAAAPCGCCPGTTTGYGPRRFLAPGFAGYSLVG